MGGKVEYDRKDGNHYITITTGKEIEEPTEGNVVTTKQAKAIVGDGKEVTALADKYRYSYMNLGQGHYFDYKQNQKGGFIEPVIQLKANGSDLFSFSIMNKAEYREKGGYEVKFECVSHPEYLINPYWVSFDSPRTSVSLPKKYGAKIGDVVKYEISIRNGDTVKTYPFTIKIGEDLHEV